MSVRCAALDWWPVLAGFFRADRGPRVVKRRTASNLGEALRDERAMGAIT